MRYLMLVLPIAASSACTETVVLTKPAGEVVAQGKMNFHFHPPYGLVVNLDGKKYAGNMDKREVDNKAELYELFGAYSKRSREIRENLLHAYYHVHHYTGVLKAGDGDRLTCNYFVSNDDAFGTCKDAKGVVYDVHRQSSVISRGVDHDSQY